MKLYKTTALTFSSKVTSALAKALDDAAMEDKQIAQ
jgi:hypothetical protein